MIGPLVPISFERLLDQADGQSIVNRAGADFVAWADHAIHCEDRRCSRCLVVLIGYSADDTDLDVPRLRPGRIVGEL